MSVVARLQMPLRMDSGRDLNKGKVCRAIVSGCLRVGWVVYVGEMTVVRFCGSRRRQVQGQVMGGYVLYMDPLRLVSALLGLHGHILKQEPR